MIWREKYPHCFSKTEKKKKADGTADEERLQKKKEKPGERCAPCRLPGEEESQQSSTHLRKKDAASSDHKAGVRGRKKKKKKGGKSHSTLANNGRKGGGTHAYQPSYQQRKGSTKRGTSMNPIAFRKESAFATEICQGGKQK